MSRRSIAAWALILAVCGCQSTPSDPAVEPDDAPAVTEQSPQALLERAADASGARRARLYLEAAEGFLDAGDTAAAAAAMAQLDPDRLRPRETARYLLASGQIATAQGRLDEARAALLAVEPDDLAHPERAALAMAALLHAEGRPTAAAMTLMQHPVDDDTAPETAQRINDALWQYLAYMPAFEVLERESDAQNPARGWWQLKSLMLRTFTLAEQSRVLDAWQDGNPRHPAARQLPSALQGLLQEPAAITRVGLLVPLSGPLSRAGRAVRDAFIATYLTHRDDVSFEVTVYDTGAEPLGTVYERALVNGSDVLVGPLSKDNVAAMNGLNPDIPVVALNYLGDETPAANLLQLGMAIEDEATTLEQWLNERGAQRVLAFHNAEEWARRAMGVLDAGLDRRITGQPVEDIRTVTESVGVAMHVARSQERHADLEALVGEELQFVARARRDVDAIVALVNPLEASALVPALKFHFADAIPRFATSQTVRGADASRLRELEGFHVSELPWFVLDMPSYQTLDEAFDLGRSQFASLYALGVDAFRLVERAPLILDGSFTELLGSTGALEFSGDGRIQRRLARVVVRNRALVRAGAAAGR